jgi:mRNA interferase MazF
LVAEPRNGEVWWGEAPKEKRRPYVVLTRDQAIPVMRTLLVAPVTRTIRDIPTEVRLGSESGLNAECVAACDGILPFPKSMLVERAGILGPVARAKLCEAVRAAIDC